MFKRILLRIIIVLALASVAFSIFVILDRYNGKRNDEKETVAIITNEQMKTGKVLGEDEIEIPSQMYSSQNYKSPQITFGGDAITVPLGEQSVNPEIQDMRSELLMTKSDQRVKFILTWKTNKLCRSSIEYLKSGQTEAKTVSEDGYGFVHSVEIAPLNYSTSYSYTVSAKDKWGNETKSDKLAFYTGAENVSILDLLAGAFRDMFGWVGR